MSGKFIDFNALISELQVPCVRLDVATNLLQRIRSAANDSEVDGDYHQGYVFSPNGHSNHNNPYGLEALLTEGSPSHFCRHDAEETMASSFQLNARSVVIEMPSNPSLQCVDIAAFAGQVQ